jgi:NAD(P)-dependent dehydrogenase (short-subunit alcohol dehydrogenase family)
MTAPSDSFAGKVFVITGGSRGLGLALARRLAQERAKLAILARDQQELVDAKSDLEKYSSALTTWVSDVLGMMWRARAGAKRMGRALHDRGDRDCTGRNDVLINNAGEIVVDPLDAMDRKDFQEALALISGRHSTLRLPIYLTYIKVVSPGSSHRLFWRKIAVPYLAPYCVSKFALVGLSDALRAELSSTNLFVTTVAPGLLRTGSHKNAFFKGQHRKRIALLVRFWTRFADVGGTSILP